MGPKRSVRFVLKGIAAQAPTPPLSFLRTPLNISSIYLAENRHNSRYPRACYYMSPRKLYRKPKKPTTRRKPGESEP